MKDFRNEMIREYLPFNETNLEILYTILKEYDPLLISGHTQLPDAISKYSDNIADVYKFGNLVEYLNGNLNKVSRIIFASRKLNIFTFSEGTVITFQSEKELLVVCNVQLYEIKHLFDIARKAFGSEAVVNVSITSVINDEIQTVSELIYAYSLANGFIYRDEISFICNLSEKERLNYIQGYTSCFICNSLEYDLLRENKTCSFKLIFSNSSEKIDFQLSYDDLIIWGDRLFKMVNQRMGNVKLELVRKVPSWKPMAARGVNDIIDELSKKYWRSNT